MKKKQSTNIFIKHSLLFSAVFTILFVLSSINPLTVTALSPKYVPLWPLIVYRPSNNGDMDDVRCWIKIEDMEGNDVTYSCCTASYAWYDTPNIKHNYQRTYYLSGGMAMHLNLVPGRYRISFYTPQDKTSQCIMSAPGITDFQWESNTFEYNTENPCNVIFVCPTANDNGFYDGGWYVDYKAPKYYIYTKPHIN